MNVKSRRRGGWSRRDLVRAGGLATASGMLAGIRADAAASPASIAAALPSPDIYTRIGVHPFINLTGTYTINGGALCFPRFARRADARPRRPSTSTS